MRKFLKWSALLVALMLSLILMVGVLLAARFDPNDLKPQLVRMVQEKNQRTLSIPGRVRLSLFPRLRAELGRVTLSERHGDAQFAAIDSASIALQLLPLLHRQVIVDRIEIDGLHAHIRRETNGESSIDDLFTDNKKSVSQPVQMDIDHIRIRNADVLYEDKATQRRLEFSALNFSSGRLTSGVQSELELSTQIKSNQPAATLTLQMKSRVTPDFERQLISFDNWQTQLQGKLGERPLNISMTSSLQMNLADHNVDGKLNLAMLQIAGLSLSNVETKLHADSGKLALNPLSASLYGGSLRGSVAVNFDKPVRIHSANRLQGIQIAPLLKDLLGKEPVEGRGDVTLDLHTAGDALPQLKRNLNGIVKLRLQDGALRGINIARTLRDAKNRLHALQSGDIAQVTGNTNTSLEKTDFSNLQATFKVINGVAHNDDLEGTSSALTIHGAGQADLITEKLDYLINASAPELQGFSLPVRLSGPFAAVGWKLDTASLGSQLLKQKKEGLQDKLQEQLKGLFGK